MVLSPALRRAIVAVEMHPETLRVQAPVRADGLVRFDLCVRVPLPSRLDGPGPFGIRREEPVTLELPDTYPLGHTRFVLRADFDTSHPHLQPLRPGARLEPCLSALGTEELVLTRGGTESLIDQLASWFARAANGTLVDLDHGWEPRRRDRFDGYVCVDESAVRGLAGQGRRGDACWYAAPARVPGDRPYDHARVVLDLDRRLTVPQALDLVSTAVPSPSGSSMPGISLVAWAGRSASGTPHVASEYRPDSVATLAGVRECARDYRCETEFTGALAALSEALGCHGAGRRFLVTILLLARRPVALLGTDSPIEISAYVLPAVAAADLRIGDDVEVWQLGHRNRLSPALLHRLARGPGPLRRPRWTLVGCGSVGSKIALHAAREGKGPERAIDVQAFEPHNFARHAMLPSAELDPDGLAWKSDALASALEGLAQPCGSHRIDARHLCAGSRRPEQVVGSGTGHLVNTTASIAVRGALVQSTWRKRRPVIVETCLFGAGRIAYLASEAIDASGKRANPDASDLVGELYHRLRSDPELAALVHGAATERVMLGQGCSSATFVLSDARLSSLAAPLATALLEVLEADAAPTAGRITFGVLDEDGLGQRWERVEVGPRTLVRDPEAPGMEVRLAPRVIDAIEVEIAARPGVETGGWLLGRFSEIGERFEVLDVLPATPGSEHRPDRFVMAAGDMVPVHRALASGTGGALRVIGTWHNHLADSGPSRIDRDAAARIAATESASPNLLLIRMTKRYRFLVAERASGLGSAEPLEAGKPGTVDPVVESRR